MTLTHDPRPRSVPVLLALWVALAACEFPAQLGPLPDDGSSTGQTSDSTDSEPTSSVTFGTDDGPETSPTTGAPPELPEVERCAPVDGDVDCVEGQVCCSDDPAVLGGRMPNYASGVDNDVFGPPLFSADYNELSHSGVCMVPYQWPWVTLLDGCPLPCNPTWAEDRLNAFCGPDYACCSFAVVDPAKDCVIDPDTQRWRAVTGADIPALTSWGDAHATNQDPDLAGCMQHASGDDGVLADCLRQLSVADQRGFCLEACPCVEDLCDAKNPGWTPRCE